MLISLKFSELKLVYDLLEHQKTFIESRISDSSVEEKVRNYYKTKLADLITVIDNIDNCVYQDSQSLSNEVKKL